MSEAAEKLKAALMELPIGERLELAEFLYECSSPPPGQFTVGTPEFDAELDRRRAELESGADPGIPAEEFFRKLREKRQ
jgi:putative addiction module component (TIGR02574 family)